MKTASSVGHYFRFVEYWHWDHGLEKFRIQITQGHGRIELLQQVVDWATSPETEDEMLEMLYLMEGNNELPKN